jgi:hypothetical protein
VQLTVKTFLLEVPMILHLPPHLTLSKLQRIKKWHVAHRSEHPLEYQLWDVMLILWVMGRVGWLPAFTLDAPWAYPLCLLAVLAPSLYVSWRQQAHAMQRLRCDWLNTID